MIRNAISATAASIAKPRITRMSFAKLLLRRRWVDGIYAAEKDRARFEYAILKGERSLRKKDAWTQLVA